MAQVKNRFYFDKLGELLVGGRDNLGKEWEGGKPAVVPVPLHPKRERWLGFNQARLIAKWLAEREGLEVKELLIRVKDAGQQLGKNRQSRLANIKDAFKLNATSRMPPAVILVDDGWTSGATMSECSRVLKQAGVRWVWGWVLTR